MDVTAATHTPAEHSQRAPIGAVVLAAVSAQPAAGFDPVWAILAEKPVLAWTIDALLQVSGVDAVVVVVAPHRLEDAQRLVMHDGSRVQVATASGPHLRDALRAGLQALPAACEWVVVHDGARPLLTPELVSAGIAAARESGAAAAAACEPVKETLKRVRCGIVVETPPRTHLALLQTPQVFRPSALLAALQTGDPHADSPDAGALAIAAGIPLATFSGSSENLRVATADDLGLAAELLARRAETA